jgi:phage repressor protein C with HTH and peptisase S24 domain
MNKPRRQNVVPRWAEQVSGLRQRLAISQGELARRLDCSAMTVSRWERGQLKPSADHYIGLGKIAGKSECWSFWERAGLRSADVQRVMPQSMRTKLPISFVPELEPARAGGGIKSVARKARLVPIPLLKAVVGSHGIAGAKKLSLDRIPAERLMGAPSEWCPNPSYTSLVRVRGNSMMPIIHDGDIAAVDSCQTDRAELDGKIVIVSSDKTGLCVSRFRHYQTVDVLESENHEYESIVLDRSSGFRIIARVLWWITAAP